MGLISNFATNDAFFREVLTPCITGGLFGGFLRHILLAFGGVFLLNLVIPARRQSVKTPFVEGRMGIEQDKHILNQRPKVRIIGLLLGLIVIERRKHRAVKAVFKSP